MTKQLNKLTVFQRGGLMHFYLNLTMEECKRRNEEYIKNISPIQREQELEKELKIHEFNFVDEFEVWSSVGSDCNDFVSKLLRGSTLK